MDSRVIFGSQMYRQIQSAPWSRKAGLAGKDMQQISVADVSYRGWNEGSLRYLSAGKYVGVVWTKSVAENVFCDQIASTLRTSDIRIDDLVIECWRKEHPDQPIPDKIQDPAQFMKPLVDQVILTTQQYQPAKAAQPPDLRIQELEAELQALKQAPAAQGLKRPAPSPAASTPVKKAPLARYFSPLAKTSVEVEEDPPAPTAQSPWEPESRPLATDAPRGPSDPDIKKWIRGVKKKLDKEAAKQFETAIKDIKQQYADMPDSQKPSLPDVAAAYGLPVVLAAKITEDSLLGIIATAVHLTAD